jgi:hypothetical protein
LAGQSCTTQGYDGGTLSCNGSCTGYVTSSCTNNPPATGLPAPSTTGWQHTGVTLSSCEQYVSGGNYVLDGRSAPLVVDGCDFYGRQVKIYGEVTLKRSRVRDNNPNDGAGAAIRVEIGAGPVLIEDVEVTTTDLSVTSSSQRQDRSIGIFKNNSKQVTIRRAYNHDTTRGLEMTGQGT